MATSKIRPGKRRCDIFIEAPEEFNSASGYLMLLIYNDKKNPTTN